MAFYHDVAQGEPFKPNMGLSNDVRHLLNAFGGVGAPRIDNSLPQRALVATYISGASISAGLPVTLSSSDGEEITGAPFTTGDIAYGVNIQDVESGVGGRAVVGGVAMISGITGTAGTYTHVTPVSGGWEYADDGLPLIWASGTAGLVFMEHSVGGDGTLYWAEQTTSGIPVNGLSVNLYDAPNGTLKGSGTAYCEPVSASVSISGAKFWVRKTSVTAYSPVEAQ